MISSIEMLELTRLMPKSRENLRSCMIIKIIGKKIIIIISDKTLLIQFRQFFPNLAMVKDIDIDTDIQNVIVATERLDYKEKCKILVFL